MPRTRIHHEEKKEEFICIALNQFMLRGYEQTTINHILKAADISKGALYHYFSSKDEILDAVMDYLMEHEIARLRSLIADPSLSGSERLIRLIITGTKKPEELQEVLKTYRKIRNSLFHYRLQEESMLATAAIFTDVIADGVASGDFHIATPPNILSELIAGTLQTMVTATEAETGEINELRDRVAMFIRLLEWGLGVKSGLFSGISEALYEQILIYRGCLHS